MRLFCADCAAPSVLEEHIQNDMLANDAGFLHRLGQRYERQVIGTGAASVEAAHLMVVRHWKVSQRQRSGPEQPSVNGESGMDWNRKGKGKATENVGPVPPLPVRVCAGLTQFSSDALAAEARRLLNESYSSASSSLLQRVWSRQTLMEGHLCNAVLVWRTSETGSEVRAAIPLELFTAQCNVRFMMAVLKQLYGDGTSAPQLPEVESASLRRLWESIDHDAYDRSPWPLMEPAEPQPKKASMPVWLSRLPQEWMLVNPKPLTNAVPQGFEVHLNAAEGLSQALTKVTAEAEGQDIVAPFQEALHDLVGFVCLQTEPSHGSPMVSVNQGELRFPIANAHPRLLYYPETRNFASL